jgi:ADP-ribose pyrophosphatase
VPGATRLDAGEFLEVGIATLEDLEALAEQGELTDAKTLVGMLWLRHWRAGRWSLDWVSAPEPPDRNAYEIA